VAHPRGAKLRRAAVGMELIKLASHLADTSGGWHGEDEQVMAELHASPIGGRWRECEARRR
jgi:hypothetical protein